MACEMTIALLEQNIERLKLTIEADERKLTGMRERMKDETHAFRYADSAATVDARITNSINYNSQLIADIEIAIKILSETNLEPSRFVDEMGTEGVTSIKVDSNRTDFPTEGEY